MDMTVQVRYRYRLRVNSSQVAQLQPVFDACRFVWNQALGRWRDLWRQERISLSYGAADKELTDWRSRFDWLSEQPSVPQQQVLRDLYQAITAFLDQTNPAGRPDFKRKGKHSTARWTKRGFSVSGTGLGKPGEHLELTTGTGRVRVRVVWSRPLPSAPTSVTVYRDPAGRWWASFVLRVTLPLRPAERTDRATGLDLGLDTFATTCAAERRPHQGGHRASQHQWGHDGIVQADFEDHDHGQKRRVNGAGEHASHPHQREGAGWQGTPFHRV